MGRTFFFLLLACVVGIFFTRLITWDERAASIEVNGVRSQFRAGNEGEIILDPVCSIGGFGEGCEVPVALKNCSVGPIELRSVKKGCGCFDVAYEPAKLHPGQSALLGVHVPPETLLKDVVKLSMAIHFDGGFILPVTIPIRHFFPVIVDSDSSVPANRDFGVIEVSSLVSFSRPVEFKVFSSDRLAIEASTLSTRVVEGPGAITSVIRFSGNVSPEFKTAAMTVYSRRATVQIEGEVAFDRRDLPLQVEILAAAHPNLRFLFSGFLREYCPYEVSRKVLDFESVSERLKFFVYRKDGNAFEPPIVTCERSGVDVKPLGVSQYAKNSFEYSVGVSASNLNVGSPKLNDELVLRFQEHSKEIRVKLLGMEE